MFSVAQIFNLLYRGFATRRRYKLPRVRFAFRRPADCKSAIQQIANLRYVQGGLGATQTIGRSESFHSPALQALNSE